jgi:hypothetical protein
VSQAPVCPLVFLFTTFSLQHIRVCSLFRDFFSSSIQTAPDSLWAAYIFVTSTAIRNHNYCFILQFCVTEGKCNHEEIKRANFITSIKNWTSLDVPDSAVLRFTCLSCRTLRNRLWRPVPLCEVEDPTFSRQSAHRWR